MEKNILEKETIYFNTKKAQVAKYSSETEHAAKENITSAKKEIRTHDFRLKPQKRKRKLRLRVGKFLIKHPFSKRIMEFGFHKKGVHWMNHAIFHSESGCINCKTELDI